MKDFQINIPGSKSITNRVLLLAALAEGDSWLGNVLSSDDADYMKAALRELGVGIEEVDGDTKRLKVSGFGGKFVSVDKELFLGNAGTATRFLTAALATCDFETVITGNERMQERPIAPLLDALRQLGVECRDVNGTGCPPVSVKGPMKGGRATVPGNFSSQYFSALLMAAPLAQSDVEIEVEGELVSKPYVDITLKCMKEFGMEAENVGGEYQRFLVKAGQNYDYRSYLIEGDASGATYFLGLGALNGVKAEIMNVALDAIQGDVEFLSVLEKMGCEIGGATSGKEGGCIWARGGGNVGGGSRNGRDMSGIEGSSSGINDGCSNREKGAVEANDQSRVGDEIRPSIKALGEIDLNHIPDAAMTVAVLAGFAEGVTEIVNVDNLRIKETDRIGALVCELRKIGVEAEELPTGIRIVGRGIGVLRENCAEGVEIDTYDDHRMAMCFAMAGSVLPGIKIKDPGCVAKTYPGFWEDLRSVGVKFEEKDVMMVF